MSNWMKRFIVVLMIVWASNFQSILAQDSLAVSESQRSMSKGSQTCFSITVPQAKYRDVVSGWKKFLRQAGGKSCKDENGELVLSEVVLAPLGSDSISVYSQLLKEENGIRLDAFFSGPDAVFFSTASTPSRVGSVRRFLRDFGIQQYRMAVKDELDDENKTATELRKDLDDLFHENERSVKKINESSRAIDRLKSSIRSNEKEQDMKDDEILKQKQLLSTFEGSAELREPQEKKLKEKERQKKKLVKLNESMHKDIEDYESEIRELERSIEKNNKENIPKKNEQITNQTEVVRKVSAKYNGIH